MLTTIAFAAFLIAFVGTSSMASASNQAKLDRSFGPHGIVKTPTNADVADYIDDDFAGGIGDMALDAKGRIVVGGSGGARFWDRFDGDRFRVQARTRHPGGVFGSTITLSAAGQDAFNPQITSSPDGTTTAIWIRNDGADGRVQARTRHPGGVFGSTITLSAAGQDASDPQITSSPDGTATAVWTRFNGANFIAQSAFTGP